MVYRHVSALKVWQFGPSQHFAAMQHFGRLADDGPYSTTSRALLLFSRAFRRG